MSRGWHTRVDSSMMEITVIVHGGKNGLNLRWQTLTLGCQSDTDAHQGRMDLEDTTLTEISRSQKDKPGVTPLT